MNQNPYQYNQSELGDLGRSSAINRLVEAAKPAAMGMVALFSVGAIALNTAFDQLATTQASERQSNPFLAIGATTNVEASLHEWKAGKIDAHINNPDYSPATIKTTDDGYQLLKISHGPLSGAMAWTDPHGVINDYAGSPAVQMPNGDRVHFKDGEPSSLGASGILGYRRLEMKAEAGYSSKEVYQLLVAAEIDGKEVVVRHSYDEPGLIDSAREEYRSARQTALRRAASFSPG